MAAKAKGALGTAEDYIYSMVIGNKVLSDMPPAGKISDSTGNIAENYRKLMKYDRKTVKREINIDIIEVSLVISKLQIAYRRLSFLQRRVLELYYWQELSWKEIAEALKHDDLYYSVRQIQERRRTGIEKMTGVLMVTIEAYEYVVGLVSVDCE